MFEQQYPFLHGKPELNGTIRSRNSDFYVEEYLGFQPSGQGEHLWLLVEKENENTQYVANQLAKLLGVQPKLASYSGKKDKYAVTRQWFSFPFPIKKSLPPAIEGPNFKALIITRHDKKLKTGTHKANRFEINVQCEALDEESELHLQHRVNAITQQGVPNYFGEQRFGHRFGNIEKALAMFANQIKVKDRNKRGMYLSAARSFLFNHIIAQRINQDMFKPLCGDVFMLNGSHSVFCADNIDDDLITRHQAHDIQITGPMWGEGELKTQGIPLELEKQLLKDEVMSDLIKGLENARLKQERRSLNLFIPNLSFSRYDHGFTLKFELPTGCFATSVLREIVNYTDASKNADFTQQ
ncbi:tRNA pseudouridine(13) synthase TruD [Saccharobesus litoralis]|uniref:tRNA pseudouridine synthase D n=1 Tax=Saccharobesus litoralis TaxID=2172099 RepID=A0A2S0VTQ2_9ALTE|nr:tRNA pseudouridine(13) synthase TruD [Saccharobesus litoralis]AWB67591.1 tRNA pseudouridine(13) synthase TruD [Saccharobesus litoralis]